MDVMDFLVPIGVVLAFSLMSGIIASRGEFSKQLFMGSMAIGIAVLVWIPLVPAYYIFIAIMFIVGMLFME